MIAKLHARLGTAGFIISIIALVAALSGGAYAASGGLNGKQKKEVEKIAKKVAKPGPAGKTGPQGPAGNAGSAGAKGDKGDAGEKGEKGGTGNTGNAGQSVTVNAYTGENCEEGQGEEGAEFTNGSGTAYACNGAEGPPGPEGVCSTAGCTLPTNVTETGSWFGVTVEGENEASVKSVITFPIPLATELGFAKVKLVPSGATVPTECENAGHTGAASPANPEAASGFLCVYIAHTEGFTLSGSTLKTGSSSASVGASVSGAIISLTTEGSNEAGKELWGTFAVTG